VKDYINNSDKPLFLNVKTVKGYGVDFMQTPTWHSKAPNESEYIAAMEKLNEDSN